MARYLIPDFLLLAILATGVLLAAVLLPKLRLGLVLLLFVLLGALRYQSKPAAEAPLAKLLTQKSPLQQPLSFTVLQEISSYGNRYAIRVDSLAGRPLKDMIILQASSSLLPGQHYHCLTDISLLSQDPLLYVFPHKYSALAYQLGKVHHLPSRRSLFSPATLRSKLLQNLDIKLGKNAGWAKGLLFSDTEAKQEFGTQLSQAGIMHLIVVSGLHVWLIYLVFITLLSSFVSRRVAELIFIPFIMFFAALNNWAPPITRAIIMIGTFTLARWMQRPVTGAQSLSLSLFIITLINPAALFAAGLQLSYVCLVVILFGMPRVQLFPGDFLMKHPWQRSLESLVQGISLSFLVSLAITPFTLYYFGRVSFNGIIANLVGIPLIGILLPLSGLILLVPRGLSLSTVFINAYNALVYLWQKWLLFCAGLPLSLSGEYFSLSSALALATLIVWLFVLVKGKLRLALYFCLPAFLLAGSLYYLPQRHGSSAEIIVFSCGVADCSLIRFADGRTLMIDTGSGKDFIFSQNHLSESALLNDSWLNKALLPWLSKNKVRRIDSLVLTHLHADHYGGLLALLQNVEVKNIYISQATSEQALWHFFATRPYFQPTKVTVISDTCTVFLGSAMLKFLHPDGGFVTRDENERSLVCRLDYEKQRFLFTGDIGASSEAYLIDHYPQELACDYLKIPHHGSRNSSTEAFLQQVHPQGAWLCTSNRNRFGFPHPETVRRYQRAQIRLFSTAEGSIRKKIDSHTALKDIDGRIKTKRKSKKT